MACSLAQGNDFIDGGDGRDDIIGGHVLREGLDGDDTLRGGGGADAILGDNGEIIRHTTQAAGTTYPWPNGFFWKNYEDPFREEVVREIRRYDDIDHIQGNDIIYGDDGNDILHGQRGNDYVSGGAGEDEIYGELGMDQLYGDGGDDIVLGDIGYALRRYDANGNPIMKDVPAGRNSVWHKDIVLEELGNITGMNRISTKIDTGAVTAEELTTSSLLFAATAFRGDGTKHIQEDQGGWLTEMIRFDLAPGFNDEMDGGEGDDLLIGQRGDDTIKGGSGNDVIIGDAGWNVIPIDTVIPRIHQIYRVMKDSSQKNLAINAGGDFGVVFTSDYELYPSQFQHLDTMMSSMVDMMINADHVIKNTNLLKERLGISALATSGGYYLQPMFRITPGFLSGKQWWHGNDVIEPGPGNNLVAGDDVRGFTGVDMGVADKKLNLLRDGINVMVLALANRLSTMEVDAEVFNAGFNMTYNVSIGNDEIRTHLHDGSKVNFIVGDTLTVIGRTISSGWLMNGRLLAKTKKLRSVLQRLFDVQEVLANIHHGMFEVHSRLLQQLDAIGLSGTGYQEPLHHLYLANDRIDSVGDNDVVVGDSSLLYVHMDRPAVNNFQLDKLNLFKRFRLRIVLRKDYKSRQRKFAAHISNDLRRSPDISPSQLSRLPAFADYALTAGCDTFSMNFGDNLAVGDFAAVGVVASSRRIDGNVKKLAAYKESVQKVYSIKNSQGSFPGDATRRLPFAFYNERHLSKTMHVHADTIYGRHFGNTALGEFLAGNVYQKFSDRSSFTMDQDYGSVAVADDTTASYGGDYFLMKSDSQADGQIGRTTKDKVSDAGIKITANVGEDVERKVIKLFTDHPLITRLVNDLWYEQSTIARDKTTGIKTKYSQATTSYIPAYSRGG